MVHGITQGADGAAAHTDPGRPGDVPRSIRASRIRASDKYEFHLASDEVKNSERHGRRAGRPASRRASVTGIRIVVHWRRRKDTALRSHDLEMVNGGRRDHECAHVAIMN